MHAHTLFEGTKDAKRQLVKTVAAKRHYKGSQ